MNRKQRRLRSKLGSAALALLVTANLAMGGMGIDVDASANLAGDLIIHGGGGGGGGMAGCGFSISGGGGGFVSFGEIQFFGGESSAVSTEGGISITGGSGIIGGGGASGSYILTDFDAVGGKGGNSGNFIGGSGGTTGTNGSVGAGISAVNQSSGQLPFTAANGVQTKRGTDGAWEFGGSGGHATVIASNNVSLNRILVQAGSGGDQGVNMVAPFNAGSGGNASLNVPGILNARSVSVFSGSNGEGYKGGARGIATLDVGTYTVGSGYTLNFNQHSNLKIGAFSFDLTGVSYGETLLLVNDGKGPFLNLNGSPISFSGSSIIKDGEVITLIHGVTGNAPKDISCCESVFGFGMSFSIVGTSLKLTAIECLCDITCTYCGNSGGWGGGNPQHPGSGGDGSNHPTHNNPCNNLECGECAFCNPDGNGNNGGNNGNNENDTQDSYEVLEHFGLWVGEGNRTAIIDATAENKVSFSLNNVIIDSSNYTVTSGSTIITLHEDFINTLECGDYLFRTDYSTGGYAYKTLTVDRTNIGSGNVTEPGDDTNGEEAGPYTRTYRSSPETGDSILASVWMTITILSAIGLLATVMWRKRNLLLS